MFRRFQKACVQYGVADVDLFQTTDLWDYKNIALVTQTIFAIGRAVRITNLMNIDKFINFKSSLIRHKNIPNGEDQFWDQNKLTKTNVTFPKSSCEPVNRSSVFRPEQIVVQISQVSRLRMMKFLVKWKHIFIENSVQNFAGLSFGKARKIIIGKWSSHNRWRSQTTATSIFIP